MTTKFDSPALKSQSGNYPASWHSKVPSRICMDKTIRSDIPFPEDRLCAVAGREYDAYVNSHGALSAILDDGAMLGLKPYEFTVIAWHNSKEVEPSQQAVIYDVREGGDVTLVKELSDKGGRKTYMAVNLRDQE